MGRVDLDLDALAPEPKSVRLWGKVWLLPADLLLSTVVRLTRFAESGDAEASGSELPAEMAELLLELFRVHQPNLEKLPPLSLKQAWKLLDDLYQLGLSLEDDTEAEAGSGKSAGGTRSTPRRAATRAS